MSPCEVGPHLPAPFEIDTFLPAPFEIDPFLPAPWIIILMLPKMFLCSLLVNQMNKGGVPQLANLTYAHNLLRKGTWSWILNLVESIHQSLIQVIFQCTNCFKLSMRFTLKAVKVVHTHTSLCNGNQYLSTMKSGPVCNSITIIVRWFLTSVRFR